MNEMTTLLDSPPDEARELKALQNSLILARGFQLLFVVCNDEAKLRGWLADQLLASIPGLYVKILGTQTSSISATLQNEEHPLLLLGFDNLLIGQTETRRHPLIAGLNKDRSAIIEAHSYPLVFAISRFALNAIAQGAPDFFSIRSGVFYIPSNAEESFLFQEVRSSGRDDLDFGEKTRQLNKINSLLEDLDEAPLSAKNISNRMFLLNQKFGLLSDLGRHDEAEDVARADLYLAQISGDKESQAISLINLVRLLNDHDKSTEKDALRQQAMELLQELPELRPAFHQELGLDFMSQGKYEEAIASFEKALSEIDENSATHQEWEVGILVNMGISYSHLGDNVKAETKLLLALKTAQERNLNFAIAHAIGNLAVVYSWNGRWQEAYELYATAAKMLAKHGTKDALLIILVGWATLNEKLDREDEGQFLRCLAGKTIDGLFAEVAEDLQTFEDNNFVADKSKPLYRRKR